MSRNRTLLVIIAIAIAIVVSSCAHRSGRNVASVPASSVTPPMAAPAPAHSAEPEAPAPSSPQIPVLYENLGTYHRPITTRSEAAQKAFDQALVLTFAFNHDEAIRLFREAARLDPLSAMPWWGIALANGPHINNPAVPPERAEVAWKALEKARGLAHDDARVERDLIAALGHRYSSRFDADRGPLNAAYADAMRVVWKAHPNDADVGTLFAEAMMDLRPWDLWTADGKPHPGTEEILATLEAVMKLRPDHPGANHLYIHAVEASPNPEKGMAAADRLRDLVPDAGHLVHMPGHIDIRVGRFAAASEANIRAIAADERTKARFPKAGFYRLYMAHNHQFLTFSSMMEGRSDASFAAARAMVAGIPKEFIEQQGPLVDGLVPIVFHVMVRFGKWDDILKEPGFADDLVIANAIRHYARGVALAALGRVDEADREAAAFAALAGKVPADRPIGNNPGPVVLEIPARMLAAEIAFRKGRADESFALFREAIAKEDVLTYDEPPDWMQPVRHAFGATLLTARKYEEAEKVFREDLKRFPENGWSLFGLARALRGRDAAAEATEVERRFDKAWARADVKIKSPCYCQAGE